MKQHEQEPKRQQHNWQTRRIVHWPICSKCGLVRLRNDATRRAVNKACPDE